MVAATKSMAKLLVVSSISGGALIGCQSQHSSGPETDAEISTRDASADPHHEHFGVRVNLSTNMATFYEDGKAIRQWKIASARNDGKSATPQGRFRFHRLTTCVPWKSTRNGASAGPCAGGNPLGYRALWFLNGEYGMHGVDSSHISSVTQSTAEGRRQSSGCVRNHPKDIEWLTNKVAPLYGTTAAELNSAVSGHRQKSLAPVQQGLALEIGRWPVDDRIGSGAQPSAPAASAQAPASSSHSEPNGSDAGSCSTSTADGMINSDQSLAVHDREGKQIGFTKPFEPVCPTDTVHEGKRLVFFPIEPTGLGWVPVDKVREDCRGGGKWQSPFQCWSSKPDVACLALCATKPK